MPAQLRVLVTRRPRYACRRCSGAVVQAHAPEHVVPGGLPTEALIAQVIVAKFGDHLPFSVIGRVWSSVRRAGPCFCPWSAGRHKMRTMVGREALNLYLVLSATWADTSSSRPASLLGTPTASDRLRAVAGRISQRSFYGGGARVEVLCRFMPGQSPWPRLGPGASPRRPFRISTSPAAWSPACAPRPRWLSSCKSVSRCAVPMPSMAT